MGRVTVTNGVQDIPGLIVPAQGEKPALVSSGLSRDYVRDIAHTRVPDEALEEIVEERACDNSEAFSPCTRQGQANSNWRHV
jgi:hypothetical protein